MDAGAVVVVLGVGVAIGVLSGLIGIGGGVLIVPFLYFFYGHPEWFGVAVAPEIATVVAHATSLFVIVPTAVRGSVAFHRSGLVVWRAVWPVAIASMFAAALAAQAAALLPPGALRIAFGALLLYSAGGLLARRRVDARLLAPRPLRLSLPVTLASGGVVGVFSALLGVGGGVVTIPILTQVIGIELRRVAATSLGIVALTSLAGVLSYIVGGIGVVGRPPWSVGFVDLGVGGVMAAGATLSVPWGAALNQRLRPRLLAVLFGGLFALLGAWLIAANLNLG